MGLTHRTWLVSTAPLAVEPEPAPGATSMVRIESVSPNPSHEGSHLRFRPGGPAIATVTIQDVSGRIVRTISSERYAPGAHDVYWDGADARGRRVPPGIYLWRVRSGALEASRKFARLD